MQNDGKLPPAQRRNYKSVVDALVRIVKEEGFSGLTTGLGPNVVRGMLMTASQI
ncbi:Mitochondrial dicarboxylate transporter, partial [Nowakowskiella sp. JEL0078]